MGKGDGLSCANSAPTKRRGTLNMNPDEAERKRTEFLKNSNAGEVLGVVEGRPLIPSPATKHKPGRGRVLPLGKHKISKIVTGGQSGVDRGSLDFARSRGVDVGGWCPKGGWAEDMTTSPGLLGSYPEMQETESDQVEQRTQWNVRDSDATLIFLADSLSSGSNLTADTAKALGLPHKTVSLNDVDTEEIRRWIQSLDHVSVLNLAGPRESENPGSYKKIQKILEDIFSPEKFKT